MEIERISILAVVLNPCCSRPCTRRIACVPEWKGFLKLRHGVALVRAAFDHETKRVDHRHRAARLTTASPVTVLTAIVFQSVTPDSRLYVLG